MLNYIQLLWPSWIYDPQIKWKLWNGGGAHLVFQFAKKKHQQRDSQIHTQWWQKLTWWANDNNYIENEFKLHVFDKFTWNKRYNINFALIFKWIFIRKIWIQNTRTVYTIVTYIYEHAGLLDNLSKIKCLLYLFFIFFSLALHLISNNILCGVKSGNLSFNFDPPIIARQLNRTTVSLCSVLTPQYLEGSSLIGQ